MDKYLGKDNLFYGLRHKLTEEQEVYLKAIFEKTAVFCNAKSGTGKTTIAVAAAKFLIESKKYNKLLYVFNPTEEDEMGHRPGFQSEKEFEYLGPLRDALSEVNEQPDIINSDNGWVIAKSHTFVRGTNTENAVVIIDEAQNWTKPKLKKMLTRLHDNSMAIVIGHDKQCDLPNPELSGFVKYIEHFRGQEKAAIITLTKNFRGWLSTHADSC